MKKRKKNAREYLIAKITEFHMAPFYKYVATPATGTGIELDASLLKSLEDQNAATLAALEEKLKVAKANEGESEVRDALLAKANHFAKIGDKENALTAYDSTLENTVGAGGRLDVVFTQMLVCVFWQDFPQLLKKIGIAKTMIDDGGDWDRRNRLKAYEATYFVCVRDFASAAKLFLETLPTFTSYELFSFNSFVSYTVLMSMVALDRTVLRKQVIKAPEILTVIKEIPNLEQFMNSFYDCRYDSFFQAFVGIIDAVKADWILGPHTSYFTREIRVVAYKQYLESYQSVTLQSMANAFGVTPAFMDRELSRFIASRRVNAKIDAVAGIIVATRPDTRSAQYLDIIKQGDLLFDRVQKLARVVTFN